LEVKALCEAERYRTRRSSKAKGDLWSDGHNRGKNRAKNEQGVNKKRKIV
jgi:hypothetical protein